MSATERPDAAGGGDPPEPTGVPAVLAMAGLFAIVLAIVGLVALGGWVALVGAVVLMIAGAAAVAYYVERISVSWTPRERPPAFARPRGFGARARTRYTAGADYEPADVSVHDLPLDNPERRVLAERDEREARTARRAPSSERREPLVRRGERGAREVRR